MNSRTIAVAGRQRDRLDGPADVADPGLRGDDRDAGVHGPAGGVDQVAREAASTSPTRNVAEVSPCTPSMKAVTSTLTMSPSRRRRESGIPWQTISLTEVHSDLGIAAVVEGRRVRTGRDHGVVADAVELVGGHPGSHVASDLDQRLGGHPTGHPHGLDLGGGADGAGLPRRRRPRGRVVRSGDAAGHGAQR
jgi:hypothetical protein